VLALVRYWSTTKIILFVKVKVLGGGLCVYGWVTILLYCLWKKEHISFILLGYGPTLSSDILTTRREIVKLCKLVMAPVTAVSRSLDYVVATNPNPCVQALMMKHLT
jgi:hypothetical protein